jgi:hypothetical protein
VERETIKNYLYDLGSLLKAEAIEAARERDASTKEQRSFFEGIALAHINVLQLLLSQAAAFGLDPSLLHLENFDPDTLH